MFQSYNNTDPNLKVHWFDWPFRSICILDGSLSFLYSGNKSPCTREFLNNCSFMYGECGEYVAVPQSFTLARGSDLACLQQLGCPPASSRQSAAGTLVVGCACGGVAYDMQAVKALYTQLTAFFKDFLVNTHSSEYTQFVMFYFLSIRPGLVGQFLEMLRGMFASYSAPPDVRKNAMAYMGSLLVRGKFISFKLVQNCITAISNWCQNYVNSHKNAVNNFANAQIHQVFYCACQTIFYVITFKCEDFISSVEAISFVRNLSIGNLIYSGLNPLAVCSPAIVDNFAKVALHYEIAVCSQVIERNKRDTIPIAHRNVITSITGNAVDVNFPFDPLPPVLKSANCYVEPFFQEFKGLPDEVTERMTEQNEANLQRGASIDDASNPEDDELDDFINESGSFTNAGLPMLLNDL